MKYVALLRGVNVNGIKITNKDLTACIESTGLSDVQCVLQTGNVIFESDKETNELISIIEQALRHTFNYEAFIVLKSKLEIEQIIHDYPYELSDNMNPYVIFSNHNAFLKNLSLLPIDSEVESTLFFNHHFYWQVKKGMTLDSTFGKSIGIPKYKPYITSRNLRTVEKILSKM